MIKAHKGGFLVYGGTEPTHDRHPGRKDTHDPNCCLLPTYGGYVISHQETNKATTMAVTLETELQSLMFSSHIPDIVIGTSDDNEVEVCLDCRDHTIFSALHFPYGRSVKIHDLRSVVEYYLRDRNISLDEFQLRSVTNGTQQILATFQVLYLEQHFTGDIGEFLRNNFLTTMAAKLTSPQATEFLYFFIEANAQEEITYQVVASVYGGEPRIYTLREDCGVSNSNRIKTVELTCEMLTGIVESPANGRPREAITLHAYSVHAGQRAFTFYVQDHEPALSLYFRNAFNVYERCDLQAVTTHKPKSDRSIAVTHRLSTFYNQQNEKQYEVETAGLTMEQARWIEQLFYSHDVRMATRRTDFSEDDFGNYNPQYMPIVLITDFTCEIHDEDGELNTVKFTYQYQDRRTYLPTDYLSVDHDRIFTAPFNPTYN